ncbi:MAG: ribonuclease HI [Acidobacteria bacterium]|nr:ribonuclease HI [Acidobacteriota bacterium]
MKQVELITDGACSGNPGPGGWAAILKYGQHKKELWGCEAQTTNNRMELQAAVEGLKLLKERCVVTIVTDSEYVRKGITEWIHGWKRNNWRTASKQPVKNQDLWEQLDHQVNRHEATWKWVKGHADHPDNNRCDELAVMASKTQSSST